MRAGDTDGNDATIADPNWSSLLNTPAHPDYTSGHSVLGGASAEVLRRFFRSDHIPFTNTSGVPFAGPALGTPLTLTVTNSQGVSVTSGLTQLNGAIGCPGSAGGGAPE